jgi:hypothetical protein
MTPSSLHDRLYFIATIALVAVIGVLAAGCSSTPTGVAELAGRYELRSVDGRSLPDDRLGGVISGELVLTASGRVTRTVIHARSGLPEPATIRYTGTYRVRGSTIMLSIASDGSPVTTRWQVNGEVRAPTTVLLRFPGPVDAAIEEIYVRSTP